MRSHVHSVLLRCNTFWKLLVEANTVLRDQGVTIRTRLVRIWRMIFRQLLGGPALLSDTCGFRRDIIFRRLARGKAPEIGRLGRLLFWLHPLPRSAALGGGLLLILIAVSLVYGALHPEDEPPESIKALSGTLASTAEMLSGAASILFAVIVFGIQFHGEQKDEAAFLVRYLQRREGLMPLAAFTFAVVGANSIVAMAAARWPFAVVPMAVLNVPLVIIVLVGILLLLYRTVVSISDDFADFIRPSLTWEYDLALDEEIHHTLQVTAYEQEVKRANLRYSPVGDLIYADREHEVIPIHIPARGAVCDIDFTALEALGNHIGRLAPGYEGLLCIGPGDQLDEKMVLALVLRVSDDAPGEDWNQKQPTPDEQKLAELRRATRQVFRCGRSTLIGGGDLVGVLSRFHERLVYLARRGPIERFRQFLALHAMLITRGIAREEAGEPIVSAHRASLPNFMGGFKKHDVARSAVDSGDKETLDELLRFTYQIVEEAINHHNGDLIYQAGDLIHLCYARTLNSKKSADEVSVFICTSILGLIELYAERIGQNVGRTDMTAEVLVLRSALAFILSVMRTAIEGDQGEHVSDLHERMWDWVPGDHRRFPRRFLVGHVSEERQEGHDLYAAFDIVLAAWCLHILREGKPGGNAAKAAFELCRQALQTRHDVLRVYEVVGSKSYAAGSLSACFGASHWTSPVSEKPWQCTVTTGEPDEWLRQGVIALLLSLPSLSPQQVPGYFSDAPDSRPLDGSEVRREAAAVLADKDMRRDVLGIPDEEEDQAIQQAADLCDARLCLFKRRQLREAIASRMDVERVREVKEEILQGLSEERGLMKVIRSLDGLGHKGNTRVWPHYTREFWIWKQALIRGGRGHARFHYLARDLAFRENQKLAGILEQRTDRHTELHNLSEIVSVMQDTMAALRSRGYNASLILLPRQVRFVRALTGLWPWELPDHRTLSGEHWGSWEGTHLFPWPYGNCCSIVAVDVAAFFGLLPADDGRRMDLHFEDRRVDEQNMLLELAEGTTCPAEIPDPDKVNIVGVVRLVPEIGIRHGDAALRINLDLEKLGYAMLTSDTVYHRPGCGLLAGQTGIEYWLTKQLEGESQARQPCQKCRPDELENDLVDEPPEE